MTNEGLDIYQTILGSVFIIVFIFVAIFDLYVSYAGFPDKTVSSVLRQFGKNHPGVVLLCGFILGHIWG